MTTTSGVMASLRDIINLNSIFTNFLSIVFHLYLSFIILICWEIKVRIRALNRFIIQSSISSHKTKKRYDNLHILHNQFNTTIMLFNQFFGFDLMILSGNFQLNSDHLIFIYNLGKMFADMTLNVCEILLTQVHEIDFELDSSIQFFDSKTTWKIFSIF